MKILIFFLFITLGIQAQDLLTVNGKGVSLSSFENSQKTSLESLGVQKTIEDFIDFELLKQYAFEKGVENLNVYQVRYNNAMVKIKDSLFYPKDFTDRLIDTQFERSKVEREGQFIILYDENPSEKQANYEKLTNLRNDILSKKITFDQAAQKYSHNYNPPLYFAAFEYQADLEGLLFDTPVGEISPVYQTGNLTAIAKVSNQRPALGELYISQLAIKGKDSFPKIAPIQKEISQGLPFEEAVKKYSEDENSKKTNGMIAPISGAVQEELYEVFSKMKVGEVSPPVFMNDTFYLFKLDGVNKFQTKNADAKKQIRKRLYTSSYVPLLEKQASENVKKNTPFSLNQSAYDTFIFTGKTKNTSALTPLQEGTLFTIDSYKAPMKKIVDSLAGAIKTASSSKNLDEFSKNMIDNEIQEQLMLYYTSNFDKMPHMTDLRTKIEKELALEYLFDDVFENQANDEKLLQTFYEKNKKNYTFPERVQATVYYCATPEIATQVEKMLKEKKTSEEIKNQFKDKKTEQGNLSLFINKGTFSRESEKFPKAASFSRGIQRVKDKNYETIVVIDQVEKPRIKTFEEAKQQIKPLVKSNLIQDKIKELKGKAQITINNQTMELLKTKYKD